MAEKRKREKLIQKYKTILSGEEDSDLIKRPKSSIDPDNNASSDFNNNNNGINMDIIEIKGIFSMQYIIIIKLIYN